MSENDNYVMNMKCSTFLLILLYWNLPQQIIKRVKKEGFTKEYSDNHSFNSFIIRICGLPFVPNLLIYRALILLERLYIVVVITIKISLINSQFLRDDWKLSKVWTILSTLAVIWKVNCVIKGPSIHAFWNYEVKSK